MHPRSTANTAWQARSLHLQGDRHAAASAAMGDVAAVDETFKRIQGHKGVIGVVVLNADGIAIRWAPTCRAAEAGQPAGGPVAGRCNGAASGLALLRQACPPPPLCPPVPCPPPLRPPLPQPLTAMLATAPACNLVRSTFDPEVTVQYAALVSQFTVKSRHAVKNLDPDNELQVRSPMRGVCEGPCMAAGLPPSPQAGLAEGDAR
jgi:hypothetical protein